MTVDIFWQLSKLKIQIDKFQCKELRFSHCLLSSCYSHGHLSPSIDKNSYHLRIKTKSIPFEDVNSTCHCVNSPPIEKKLLPIWTNQCSTGNHHCSLSPPQQQKNVNKQCFVCHRCLACLLVIVVHFIKNSSFFPFFCSHLAWIELCYCVCIKSAG